MSKQLKTPSFFLMALLLVIVVSGISSIWSIGIVVAQDTEEPMTTNTSQETAETNTTVTEESTLTEDIENNESDETSESNSTTTNSSTVTNTTTTTTTIEETNATNTTETNQTVTTNTTETNESIAPVQSISLEKITPVQISVGEQQLNIMVKNTGTISLFSVEAEVTGYGITTAEKISIEELPVGEKDYTFTKVLAEKAGIIDLIIKISSNGTLLLQEISVLEIVASPEEVVVEETEAIEETRMNSTVATILLNETRNAYSEIEKEYYQKEKEEYVVYGVKEDLSEIKEFLREAQVALIEQDQKKFDKNILTAKTSIETVAADLATAEKEQKTLGEIISENLTLIGSLLGVFISAVTVWSITKAHLKNTRVVNIIKGKQIITVDKETKVENKQSSEK